MDIIKRRQEIKRGIYFLLITAFAIGLLGCANRPVSANPICRRDAKLTYHIPDKPNEALGKKGKCDLPDKVFEILGVEKGGQITVSREYIQIGVQEDGTPLYLPNLPWTSGEVMLTYKGSDGGLIKSGSCTSNPFRTQTDLEVKKGKIGLSCFTDKVTISINK